jgi:hypothetical protein
MMADTRLITEVEADRLERRIRQKASEIVALGEDMPVDEFRGALEVALALWERYSKEVADGTLS